MTTLTIPTLTTERLTLRAHCERDLPALTDFYGSDRSLYVGGPRDEWECWRTLTGYLGHWALRGFGFWAVENHAGDTVGSVGFIYSKGWYEPELGWHLYTGHEGKGYATEATLAARAYGALKLGLNGVISYIAHDNTRSIRMAEKLGATFEREGALFSKSCLIYRHPKEPVL
ncbi:MAG: GNAT family N-acetyltransferase [Pseudomonadota bacterium]